MTDQHTPQNNAADAPSNGLRHILQALIASGLLQAEIAREADVSSTTLSRWLKGQYAGNEAITEEKLSKWLKSREQRQQQQPLLASPPKWFPSPTASKITHTCRYAQIAGDMAIIYGGAGLGKTTALRRYAEENPSVWVIEMTRSHSKLLGALERIAAAVGLKGLAREPAKVQDRIHDRVSGTNGLLVIDEAQHLDNEALEAIRAIHDATGIGIVLAGNEVLYTRITGGRREMGFAQLFSRIGKRLRLSRPSKEDVASLAEAWGIVDADIRDLMGEIAMKPGALRGLTKALRLASMTGGISAQNLTDAWQNLGGAE
jgi:hypothetical protein